MTRSSSAWQMSLYTGFPLVLDDQLREIESGCGWDLARMYGPEKEREERIARRRCLLPIHRLQRWMGNGVRALLL